MVGFAVQLEALGVERIRMVDRDPVRRRDVL
jgi:hypothetical protein